MKNILLFLCSGTSSRFNGKTKALAKISGTTVIEFNLKNVSEFDQVYIVANETNYSEFEKLNLENVKLIKIKTGNGDADSLLNALKELQKTEDFENTSLTFCWGDTLFLNDTIFKKLSVLIKEKSEDLLVPCSLDKNPYAYFDFITDSGNIDGSKILKVILKPKNQ